MPLAYRVGYKSSSRAVHVAGVGGVVDTAGLHHEVETVEVFRQKPNRGLRHFHYGRLVAFTLRKAVVVVAQVARGE